MKKHRFKSTFEESVYKRHSSGGSCWCPRASVTEQTSLQNTRPFFIEKILRIGFGDCVRNISQCLGGKGSTLLV